MKALLRASVILLVMGLVCSGCGKKEAETEQPPEQPKTGGAEKPQRSPDQALKTGIAFLKNNQNEDGSFGKLQPGVGITALCVYGVANSKQASDPDAKQVIDRAAKYILSNQKPDGSINNHERMLAIYRTSLSVMALTVIDAEKYEEPIARGREYLKKSQFIEANGDYLPEQWEYGGWDYAKENDEPDPDLSNVQFALSALKESGLSPDDEAFKRAIIFLQRCQNRTESNDVPPPAEGEPKVGNDGGAIYTPRQSKAGVVELPDGTKVFKSYGSMTYALLKSYIFCGLPTDDARVRAAYDWIAEHYTVDENPGIGQMGLFYYYLSMARALDAFGAKTVKTTDGREHNWRAELAAKLISMQNDDGSWVNPEDRWVESDPTLVTGYAITVLNYCRE